ncbi:MAG TPA: cytochrome b/b6 domain-containing protein [Usitatibacter sp.]|nr:cytochrome b/b6 domain-containing protein [Usitatibacter sp.]
MRRLPRRLPGEALSNPASRRGWDLPTRVFHWTLALLVTFSFVTGKVGESWMDWHMRSGYAIVSLLLFRIAWGIVGSREARFASFVRGPAAARAYLQELRAGRREVVEGHNPLGAWSVVAMLALLALQVATGLFSNDESSHEGPLATKVSNATVDRMSSIHGWNQYAVLAIVVLHVAAVAVYQWRLRMDVIGPMVHGPARARDNILAAVLVSLSACATYWLVVVYPR